MNIQRCSATKNTFFFVSEDDLHRTDCPAQLQTMSYSSLAQRACQQFGSGADGLVIVKAASPKSNFDYEWDFYNKDGSSAEMCGNAARCMAFYVKTFKGFDKPSVAFKTLAGPVEVKILDAGIFSVKMPAHHIHLLRGREQMGSQEIVYSFINTGVPHAVLEVPTLVKQELLPLVKHFRFHPTFGAAGANVSFYCRTKTGIEGVTFERGVEDFTASCGTGVVAMGLVNFYNEGPSPAAQKDIEIQTPGGLLKVTLDESAKFCWLTGPAGLDEEVEFY